MKQFIARPKSAITSAYEPFSASTILNMLEAAGIDTTKHQYIVRRVDSDLEVSQFRFYAPGDWVALWVLQTGDAPTFENILAQFNGPKEMELSFKRYIEKYPTVDKFRFGDHVFRWSNREGLHTFELYNNDTGKLLIGDYFVSDTSEYDW